MSFVQKKLYQIGEAANMLGISRRMLLNYEEHGLVKPDTKDAASGYRYYSADTIVHIKLIRTLQMLGLSLAEIREYTSDTANMQVCLERLIELRDSVNRNIDVLRQRLITTSSEVLWVSLEKRICYCRDAYCEGVGQTTALLRAAYDDVVSMGLKLSPYSKLFTLRENFKVWEGEISCCIPIDESYTAESCVVFPETAAICVYFRGAYENIPRAVGTLTDYAMKNNLTVTGSVQNIFLEGPPTHGSNSAAFLTQVAMPVIERRKRRP